MTAAGDVAYVKVVLTSYADLPDTPARPSPADWSVARNLYMDAVPLQLVEAALLLGTLRRLTRASDLPPLPGIRSLAYFLPVIAELPLKPLPAGYLDYLRLKLRNLSSVPGPMSTKRRFAMIANTQSHVRRRLW